MIYGLYLSATGVVTNSYRQDVISNNLANAETVGFKRDLATFRERPYASRELVGPQARGGDPIAEKLPGGLLALPTRMDQTQGDLEPTDNPLDLAIRGDGYFAVTDGTKTSLTRDGRFAVNREGQLVMATQPNQRVIGTDSRPIQVRPGAATTLTEDGTILQNQQPAGQVGLFSVADPNRLSKAGTSLLDTKDQPLQQANALMRSGYVERSNVDPANELAELMDTQRQLEANANMIRAQDQILGRLVNEVGKIG